MYTRREVVSAIVAVAILILGAMPAQAATEEEIAASIEVGVTWLVGQQNASTGAWQDVPRTGFVLIKLQDLAYEWGYESPFDALYDYSDNVIAGWQYLLTGSIVPGQIGQYARKHTISGSEPHGDPDTNGNGYGISFQNECYNTGICLMALAATGTPGRANDGGLDYDGDGNADTYGEIAQDVVDWLAYAQVDSGNQEGAWGYGPNAGGDNSVSGYVVLGLAAAEGFGCTIPGFVKTELNVFINNVQDPVNGDTHDGGSWYRAKVQHWVNLLKTGNLIFEMTFYGDSPATPRFQDAIDYIERHWRDADLEPGWNEYGLDDDGDGLVDEDPRDYIDNDGDGLIDEDCGMTHFQAVYCLMKGLEYSGVDLIDTDGDSSSDDDWFNQEPPAVPAQDFASVLVAQQNVNGSWPSSPCYVWPGGAWGTMSGEILSTVWALLTLEKISPPPPEIPVSVDIKPQSCPNPFNIKSRGVLPVAVLGTDEFDVTDIDPATIVLSREGVEGAVSLLRWAYEDVATPFGGELCDCHELGGDGYLDLTLKFRVAELVMNLELYKVGGETLPLTLTGNLKSGTPIRGEDCVWVLSFGANSKKAK